MCVFARILPDNLKRIFPHLGILFTFALRFCKKRTSAQMAKLVDALVSGTSDRKVVQVRVLFWAPKKSSCNSCSFFILANLSEYSLLNLLRYTFCRSVQSYLQPFADPPMPALILFREVQCILWCHLHE